MKRLKIAIVELEPGGGDRGGQRQFKGEIFILHGFPVGEFTWTSDLLVDERITSPV